MYLTAFGVFRRPPRKELSCKPQTALAQAQQEHCLCVKHGVCVQNGFYAKQRKTVLMHKYGFCKPEFWKRPYIER
jgi:hypothetical protein